MEKSNKGKITPSQAQWLSEFLGIKIEGSVSLQVIIYQLAKKLEKIQEEVFSNKQNTK